MSRHLKTYMASVSKTIALLHLIRFDRPIGTLLLLWPTLWALWLAAEGVPDVGLLGIFILYLSDAFRRMHRQ